MAQTLPVALLAAALGLLAAGVPNVAGRFSALAGDQAVTVLFQGERLGEEGFQRLLRSRERALGFVEDPAWRVELGAARMAQAMAASRGRGPDAAAEAARLLEQARERLREGLARAPADGTGWLWLAAVEARREDWPAAAAALRLSLVTAPVDPQIALTRSSLGLAAWSHLDRETRGLVSRELERTVQRAPEELVAAADGIGRGKELRAALADRPVALARLTRTERRMRGLL